MDHKPMDEKSKLIAKEMMPYFVHAIWPVLIILFMAKMLGPSY